MTALENIIVLSMVYIFGCITGWILKEDPRGKDGKFKKKSWWQK